MSEKVYLNFEGFWGVFLGYELNAAFRDREDAEQHARENLTLLDWKIVELAHINCPSNDVEPDETLAMMSCARCE